MTGVHHGDTCPVAIGCPGSCTCSIVASPAPMASGRPRGFAAVDPALVRQIASKGGKAAHAAGTAHKFTREEAIEAGRKGGKAVHAKRKKVET
jgi:uncharacterized protein